MNSTLYKYFLVILILMTGKSLYSQTVSGNVFEKTEGNKKSPLPGVNVYWIGTTLGTVTDDKGNFTLSGKDIDDRRLVISLLGYRKDTLEWTGDGSRLKIGLVPQEEQLGEVEITQKKDNTLISKLNARQTQVINAGELQRAACCNLAESFETNASVDVSYSDAVSGARQIQLLGLSGSYSSIMTENIPLI
ncbi:MAG TPA: carboxypeptidase-like regulatory domain-containing protein, partial [Bacteroidales bacterium]|nr:carboxypeptidase-like regulatory domain-containing protein [Bacteroidales bacterium]